MWVSVGVVEFGYYGKGCAKVGLSRRVGLIGWGWLIYLVGPCACRSRDGCGLVWLVAQFSKNIYICIDYFKIYELIKS